MSLRWSCRSPRLLSFGLVGAEDEGEGEEELVVPQVRVWTLLRTPTPITRQRRRQLSLASRPRLLVPGPFAQNAREPRSEQSGPRRATRMPSKTFRS